jgi:hypothetical protein
MALEDSGERPSRCRAAPEGRQGPQGPPGRSAVANILPVDDDQTALTAALIKALL